MTAVGTLNPNSRIKDYLRDLRNSPLEVTSESFSLPAFAEIVAARYDNALKSIKAACGDSRIASRGEVLAREYEQQLVLLTEYVNDLDEVTQ